MNILITGVAGLIGSNLADWIIKNHPEHKVIGIDDLSGGYIENVNDDIHAFYEFDLIDGKRLQQVFTLNKPDLVYHMAAYAAEGLSPFMRTFNYKNNLLSTAHIINNCINHDVNRLIFTSTMAVYGHGTPPFSETDPPDPIDPYGVAKYACEMDLKIAGDQHGLDWCIIRPHNVYGIKQNIWDKYRNVLGIWMYQHMKNQPMTVFGDGEQQRAFSYIDDTLEPLYRAGIQENCSKQIINLGGMTHYSINETNKILREVIGTGEKIYKEKRHEVKDAHPTWEKSVELLGYEDSYSLRDGLKEMWDWAQKQPQKNQRFWETYEIEKGIYEYWKKK
jgi:UDP-glucose 4-epimerase